jgi:2'-5' RNA ligase
MRLFVAFELPDPVRARIADRLAQLRSRLPPASWVPAERLHLTLAFLGELDQTRLAALDAALGPVFARSPRLSLRLGAAGTFPPQRPARVAWIAVEEGDADPVRARTGGPEERAENETADGAGVGLRSIEGSVRAALADVLEQPLEERPYHAHVTVARPRRPWGRSAVAAFRLECGNIEGGWEARRAVLMESRLGSAGAQYSVRQEYPLAEGRA